MYQNNRNLFPLFAVLASAGLIVTLGGLLLIAVNQLSAPIKVVQTPAGGRLSDDSQLTSNLTLTESRADLGQSINRAPGPQSIQQSTQQQSGEIGQASAQNPGIVGIHQAAVLKVAVAPGDSPLIASGSYDNTVRLWSRDNLSDSALLPHGGRVNGAVFFNQAQQLITGSGDGNLKLWNVAEGTLLSTVAGHSGRIVSLAVNADATYVASGSSNGTLKLWPLQSPPERAEDASKSANESSETFLAASKPGESILNHGHIKTIDAAGASTLVRVGSQINALAFHPTRPNLLISGRQDGTIEVWDLKQAAVVQTIETKGNRVWSLAVSPDGRYLASGHSEKQLYIWDLESGKLAGSLEGHRFVVADVAFSPDGRTLASGSYDESVRTWDWAAAKELCTFEGHSGFVHSVTFADQGRWLISGGYDGTVRRWALNQPNNRSCLAKS